MEKITINRKELYELVWSESLSTLARKYNISDNGLRKKCIKHDIPLPPMGYWMKIKHGRKVRKIPLPKQDNPKDIVLYYRSEDGIYEDPKYAFLEKLRKRKQEIESDSNISLEVPGRLTKPDKLIIDTRDYFNEINSKKGRERWQISRGNLLDINVSYKNLGRALRIMDTLIKIVKARGHEIHTGYRKTQLVMYGVSRDICIREKHRAVESEDKYSSRDLIPTGKLAVRADIYFHKEWADNKTLLEDKLSAIVAWFEVKGQELREIWDLNEKKLQEEAERQRILKEIEERKNNERVRFQSLLNEVERWHQARLIREYVDHIKSMNISKDKEWFSWAKDKAQWYDPTICEKDIILGYFKDKPKAGE